MSKKPRPKQSITEVTDGDYDPKRTGARHIFEDGKLKKRAGRPPKNLTNESAYSYPDPFTGKVNKRYDGFNIQMQ